MRTVLGVLGVILAAIVAVVALLTGIFLFAPRSGVESWQFESSVWKSTVPGTRDETRLFMVDDLLATHTLVGRSRADIVNLLGEPDSTPYFRHYDMVYYLGRERRAFGIDSEWLVLKLSAGRVSEARLVTD